MFRPRDSHDLRLLDTSLLIRPGATVRWLHDVFGNSVAIARLLAPADELVFESTFRVRHYPIETGAIELEPDARQYPFQYSADEIQTWRNAWNGTTPIPTGRSTPGPGSSWTHPAAPTRCNC